MVIIVLNENKTFKHQLIKGIHEIVSESIEVDDGVADILQQNPQTKQYDKNTKLVSDYTAPFSLSSALVVKLADINNKSSVGLSPVKEGYTDDEIKSWPTQESEAKNWKSNNAYSTPFLDGIVTNRPGMDKSTLVNKVLAKAVNFKAISGAVIGKKQAYVDVLNALPNTATQADIDAITINY